MPGGKRLSLLPPLLHLLLLLLLLLLLYSVFVWQNLRIQPNKTRDKNYRKRLRDQIIQRGTCLVDSLLTYLMQRSWRKQKTQQPASEPGCLGTKKGWGTRHKETTAWRFLLRHSVRFSFPCVLPRMSLLTNWTLLSGCFSSKTPTHKPTEPPKSQVWMVHEDENFTKMMDDPSNLNQLTRES